MRRVLTPWARLGAALALMALAACARTLAPDDDACLQAVFEQVRAGEVDAVAARLGPGVRGPGRAAQLAAMRAAIPAGAPTSITVVSWSAIDTASAGGRQHVVSAVRRYDYPGKVLLVETMLSSDPGAPAPTIEKFFIRVLTPQEAGGKPFSLRGQSPLHYTVLAFLGFSVALMIAAIVATIIARNFRRKWLWCLVSLVTVSGLKLDWDTGALTIPAKIGLVSAGVIRLGPSAPWIVVAGFPAGAMLVFVLLSMRRRTP